MPPIQTFSIQQAPAPTTQSARSGEPDALSQRGFDAFLRTLDLQVASPQQAEAQARLSTREKTQADPREAKPSQLTASNTRSENRPDLTAREAQNQPAAPAGADPRKSTTTRPHAAESDAGYQPRQATQQQPARDGRSPAQPPPADKPPTKTPTQPHSSQTSPDAESVAKAAQTLVTQAPTQAENASPVSVSASASTAATSAQANGSPTTAKAPFADLVQASRITNQSRPQQAAKPQAQGSSVFKLEQDAMLKQVQAGLARALRTTDGQITLKLTPRALGDVSVSLQVEGDAVSARLETTRDAAAEMLRASAAQLREALISRGYQVERIEISQQPSQADPQQRAPDTDTGSQDRSNSAQREDSQTQRGSRAEDAHTRRDTPDEDMPHTLTGSTKPLQLDLALGLLRLDTTG